MNTSLVSIVVPIYNVEGYLDRCLKSIVSQTYKNLEILLVDDGSPDSCPRMCDEWAMKDTRIKVIHKQNAGLGMARNTGIENVSGDYICFFDSDDYVEPETIEECIKSAEKYGSDTVIFGMSSVDENGKMSSLLPKADCEFYQGRNVLTFVLPNLLGNDPETGRQLNIPMSSCCTLISLKMIRENHWKFESERNFLSEDFISMLQLYAYINKVSIVKKCLYNYCSNNASLTHKYKADRFERLNNCYRKMLEICQHEGFPDVVKSNIYSQYLSGAILTMKLLVKSGLPLRKVNRQLSVILHNDFFCEMLRKIDSSKENSNRKIFLKVSKAGIIPVLWLLLRIKA